MNIGAVQAVPVFLGCPGFPTRSSKRTKAVRRYSSGIIIVVLGLFQMCCAPTQKGISSIQRSLASFIFVGELPDHLALYPGIDAHGSESLPFPSRLTKGKLYVFHRKTNDANSWTEVENALRANGAKIIEAPKGNVGLVYTYIGGPWYVIRFRIGNIGASFQNYPAAELKSGSVYPGFDPQDFVLRIESVS